MTSVWKTACVLVAIAASPSQALADVEAKFLGTATYATRGGCAKLKRLAAGGPRNIRTVPETLTSKGFTSWEGGCWITAITEQVPGKKWSVTLSCSEGAEEDVKSTETWAKRPDGSIEINDRGKRTLFFACAAPGPKD